jgi:PAS domain S-box-containing protein
MMANSPDTLDDLIRKNNDLQARLEAAEEALRAVQNGEVDALVIYTNDGEQIYTLEGADYTYRVMVENISEGVANLSRDGMILYGNQRMADMLGVHLESLLGSNISQYIPSLDQPVYQGMMHKTHGGSSKGEISLIRPDGSMFPALFSLNAMDNIGQRMHCLVVADLTEQKRSEEILAAEKMSRSILEQASEAILVCSNEGVIIRASQAAFAMAGINPLFQPFEMVFPMAICEHGEDFSLHAVLQGRVYQGIEVRLKHPDGRHNFRPEDTDLLLNAVPLRNEDQEILGCILSLTDISLLKKAERRIASEKEWFRTTLASIGDAVVTTDARGDVTFLNPIAEELTGWTSPEAIGYPMEEVVPIVNEQTHQPVESPVRKVMESGELAGLANHTAFISRDGSLIPIEDCAAPIRDASGQIQGVIMVFQDVGQKRGIEKYLRESRDRLLLTSEAVEIGLWTWDLESDTLNWDDRCKVLFDIHQETQVAFPIFLQAVHPEDRLGLENALRVALSARAIFKAEYRTLWSDGSVHWLYSRGQAVYGEAGEPLQMLGVVMDITDRKVIEAEIRSNQALIEVQHRLIEQREQERQQIARDLHDGPVQALIAATYALHGLRKENCPGDVAQSLEQIKNSLHEQINEMRAYAGELRPPILARFGLTKAIRSHMEGFQEKHPELTFHFSGTTPGLQLSQETRLALFRIYQEALTNIVRHAEATRVSIRLEESQDQVTLEIQDDGIGFEPPMDWLLLARQGHLGLVGIRERAEAVGGNLTILSNLDRGTLIKVNVPFETKPPLSQ